MPCYTGHDTNGDRYWLCGDLGPHCHEPGCGDVGTRLCDYPVGKEKTCDRPICEGHANPIAPEIDYCGAHFVMWRKFEESGGVKQVLENVVPYDTIQQRRLSEDV